MTDLLIEKRPNIGVEGKLYLYRILEGVGEDWAQAKQDGRADRRKRKQ